MPYELHQTWAESDFRQVRRPAYSRLGICRSCGSRTLIGTPLSAFFPCTIICICSRCMRFGIVSSKQQLSKRVKNMTTALRFYNRMLSEPWHIEHGPLLDTLKLPGSDLYTIEKAHEILAPFPSFMQLLQTLRHRSLVVRCVNRTYKPSQARPSEGRSPLFFLPVCTGPGRCVAYYTIALPTTNIIRFRHRLFNEPLWIYLSLSETKKCRTFNTLADGFDFCRRTWLSNGELPLTVRVSISCSQAGTLLPVSPDLLFPAGS